MSTSDGNNPADINTVREQIELLDQQIQSLLTERAIKVSEMVELNQDTDPASDIAFYRPDQEARLLREVARRNTGPMDDAGIQRIFREIISASRALLEPISVAYLGPEGTYSHAAALKHFGHAVVAKPQEGIAEIFHSVENRHSRFGVVPVENSTEGAINHTLDLLMSSTLRVCGEVRLRIQHKLLSCETSLELIGEVHAHPQALAQCRHWLDEFLPDAARISESSNAAAASKAKEMPGIAAIAGKSAAERYALNTLISGIEDEKTNTTRFLVIGDQDVSPTGHDSTLLLVSAPHKPGGLRSLLLPLEEAGVSMTRIESRPGGARLWEYVFFIDVAGHQHDDTLAPVIKRLHKEAPLRVLGSYPSAL